MPSNDFKKKRMIILIPSKDLNFEFGFDQPESEIREGLRQAFLQKFGVEIMSLASKIIITEKNFYHIIKDRYGNPIIGEHIDMLQDCIDQHLLV